MDRKVQCCFRQHCTLQIIIMNVFINNTEIVVLWRTTWLWMGINDKSHEWEESETENPIMIGRIELVMIWLCNLFGNQ